MKDLIPSRVLITVDTMSEEMSSHPILTYLTFLLPVILLAVALVVGASVGYVIVILSLLGVAFILFFLPVETDDGSSGP